MVHLVSNYEFETAKSHAFKRLQCQSARRGNINETEVSSRTDLVSVHLLIAAEIS